jgi:hypothetical protein
LVVCGLALIASVLAVLIAGWAQTVILNRIAAGVSCGSFVFFVGTSFFLGYPWFTLIGFIIWLTAGALAVRQMEKS